MEREEARRLLQERIDFLVATIMYQDSGSLYSQAELDDMSTKVESLRRDLAGL